VAGWDAEQVEHSLLQVSEFGLVGVHVDVVVGGDDVSLVEAVEPEECDLKRSERNAGDTPDAMVPSCPYLSVRGSDPTCEASGTTFRQRRASTRPWTRGRLGRVSESEPSSVRPVTLDWRKRLARQNQNGARGGSHSSSMRDGAHGPRRVKDGTHLQPLESSLIDRVSPMHPTLVVVSEPQGTGMVQGVEDAGGSERQAVTAWIGPRERTYPTRKGADFRLVFLGRENRARPHPGGG
jgi:hypothetical protein